ncbi:hypothetical protein [Sideroxydans sp. CL21]|uniref:hypothetical protein n=1 Tax=Sideroxydans sp. CL21 TaxID=2600596 RepID=UPI0012A8DC15|nr:hypothetical protein [Sideroxydans sp. CL21]VVC82475.1 hypothetical protein [Sideroxydans sp. CL21]
MNGLAKAFKTAVPESIDSIITLHRENASLSVLDDAHIAFIPNVAMDRQMSVKGMIEGWYVVRLDIPSKLFIADIMFGYKNGRVFRTSPVVAISPEAGLVVTRNSVYKLGTKGESEPDLALRLHVCNFLHSINLGEFFGVLHVFY